MLHPVLPPDLPPIVQPVETSQPVAVVVESKTKVQPLANSQLPSSVIKISQSASLPETTVPEFSNGKVSRSAALLGAPLSVGYPRFDKSQTETQKQVKTEKLTPIAEPSQIQIQQSKEQVNLFAGDEKEPKSEQLTPVNEPSQIQIQQSGDKVNISAGDDKDPANNLQVENTIEFKPRNSQQPVEFSPTTNPTPQTTPVRQRVVEVIADRQEYDEQRRIVTAEGKVVVRFDGTVVDADRLQVNLANLIAVGEGNVALTRGNQVLRGQRFTYNFVQDSGELEKGRGEIFIPTTSRDFAFLPTDITAGGVPSRPQSDRLLANQPISQVSSPGGIQLNVSGQADASNVPPPTSGGEVRRLRFEAETIDFYPRGWEAKNARLTNDPFSPPELELRASKVTLTREAPLIDRITTQKQRLVLDQNIILPIPIDNQTIDRRERDVSPGLFSIGFDNNKRGGLYVERGFQPISADNLSWTITPQFFVQKSLESGGNTADLFGVTTRLNATLSPKTFVEGRGELTSLDFDKLEDNLKASLRLRQTLGDVNPHTLNLEYSYRDRLYNGTLGFQTVQSSFGGVITSPVIPLGKTGINLSYQAGAQLIDANTDRQNLLPVIRKNDRISLGRLQGSAALNTGFLLWQGKPLAATAEQGLKYTPNPVVPYLQVIAGVTGTTSYYSSGDNQSTLTGTVGLLGQIGNFSRPFLDYTGFNISYSQGLNSGLSPFLFDRSVDNKVLSGGITQQLYGPLRIGFQTAVNLDTGKASSTDYILEYSRRTYGITLRYNPILQFGGFSIRISDFNWTGGTDPFSNGDIKPVVGGVLRQEE